MPQGTILKTNQSRGYGFIQTPDNDDLFFHRSNMKEGHFAVLQPGDKVTYTLLLTSRGPRADQIQVQSQSAQLQINLAVKDLGVSEPYYTNILGFRELANDPGYILLKKNTLTLGLKTDELLWHPSFGENEIEPLVRGIGIELVLEIADIDDFYSSIQETETVINEPLKKQPWGATDFRIFDPDGYLWRITSPRSHIEPMVDGNETISN